jgi:hypothetical protein
VELTPTTVRRWILPLALALSALSIVGLLPQLSSFGSLPGPGFPLLRLHYATVAVVGIFSLLTVLAQRRGLPPRMLRGLLRASYILLLFWIITVLSGMFSNRYLRPWDVIEPFASFLLSVAVPGLWASGVVSRTDPRNRNARSFGRLSAGIAVAAIGLGGLMSALESITLFGPFPSSTFRHPSVIINSIAVAILRALGLWAAIESLRRAASEEDVVRRAARIQILMVAWLGVSIAIHLYFIVTGLLGTEIPGALAGLWRGAIYRVLLVLIGALAVVDLERRGSGYNSTAPAHP